MDKKEKDTDIKIMAECDRIHLSPVARSGQC